MVEDENLEKKGIRRKPEREKRETDLDECGVDGDIRSFRERIVAQCLGRHCCCTNDQHGQNERRYVVAGPHVREGSTEGSEDFSRRPRRAIPSGLHASLFSSGGSATRQEKKRRPERRGKSLIRPRNHIRTHTIARKCGKARKTSSRFPSLHQAGKCSPAGMWYYESVRK